MENLNSKNDGTALVNPMALSLQNMKFTKIFDVKSPVCENTPGHYNNAGIDLFMPEMTPEFLLAMYKANFEVYQGKLSCKIGTDMQAFTPEELEEILENMGYSVTDEIDGENSEKQLAEESIFFRYNGCCISEHNNMHEARDLGYVTIMQYIPRNKSFHFYDRVQIPLGIAIEIPRGCYVDLRSKSGNFKHGWYEITGLIDSCYTYGMGVQLIPFHGNKVSISPKIEAGEKITQIVLNQFITIYKLTECSNNDWDSDQEIVNRRTKRQGGFGSTGKF